MPFFDIITHTHTRVMRSLSISCVIFDSHGIQFTIYTTMLSRLVTRLPQIVVTSCGWSPQLNSPLRDMLGGFWSLIHQCLTSVWSIHVGCVEHPHDSIKLAKPSNLMFAFAINCSDSSSTTHTHLQRYVMIKSIGHRSRKMRPTEF